MPRPALAAVLFDAFGTLVHLEDPVGVLRHHLAAAGHPNSAKDVAAAWRSEVAFYLAHQDDGRDAASLIELRRACAEVLAAALPNPPDLAVVQQMLTTGLPYRADPAAADLLVCLRAAGLRLGVVSNWDAGLDEVLERVGLRPHVDVVVASAVAGARKPDPAIFRSALAQLGVSGAQTMHIGDRLDLDCAGARAAGVTPVLLGGAWVPDCAHLTSLAALAGDGPGGHLSRIHRAAAH